MRWHVFGANSYIAKGVIRLLEDKEQQLYLYTRSETAKSKAFDLAAPSSHDVENVEDGDIIVLLAANSSADACHWDYDDTYCVNVVGTGQLISLCLRKGARVIFFSSDLVFGNTDAPCHELTSVCPFGNYARMKLEIETMFSNEKNFKVLRLSTVLSKDARFIRYLSSCDEDGRIAEIYDSFYRNFVFLGDVAEAVFKLGLTFAEYENQCFHLCGNELLSRVNLVEIYRQTVSDHLQYIVKEPLTAFFEARPKKIEFCSIYLDKLLGRRPTEISQAMKIEFNRGEYNA